MPRLFFYRIARFAPVALWLLPHAAAAKLSIAGSQVHEHPKKAGELPSVAIQEMNTAWVHYIPEVKTVLVGWMRDSAANGFKSWDKAIEGALAYRPPVPLAVATAR